MSQGGESIERSDVQKDKCQVLDGWEIRVWNSGNSFLFLFDQEAVDEIYSMLIVLNVVLTFVENDVPQIFSMVLCEKMIVWSHCPKASPPQ
jgi:hypothetical protein